MEKRYKLVNLDRPDRLELRMHDFHASDVPRGCAPYSLDVLADSQQRKLNKLKVNIVRENQKYLAIHPEVRALVALLLRYIFAKFPHFHIHRSITDFFSQSRAEIENAVTEYLLEK
ncbi:uncharacterized protein LOC112905544, partial [Agrilus planipennis]|uniref:Uncharacterized protein LOC112905544 n=1 Tax=Agrilus planipennis TaxID=224129 RepID=A0A7F5RDA1_AGRPL